LILSVSRRTDIPAFYLEWFFNRLKEGYVLVRNPMNYHQVSKINISPKVIDCIVFWTKNPTAIIEKLHFLENYKYYFQITVNPYDETIERNVPLKKEVIDSFKDLSGRIGKEKTVWRYDPIILTDKINLDYHFKCFELLSSELEGYADSCIISFVDSYKKIERNMRGIDSNVIDDNAMRKIGEKFVEIAHRHNIKVKTCCEKIDLSSVGIGHSKCIDDMLISKIIGQNIIVDKDKNQRDICGCISSIDIGAYNSCQHFCRYCYANYFADKMVKNNILKHDPTSPMMIGNIEIEDKITERKMESYLDKQISLFNL